MSIRKIITTGALVALIGAAGVVSTQQAFAADADIGFGADTLAVQVYDGGNECDTEADAEGLEGDMAAKVYLVDEADLRDNEFDALDIN